MNLALVAAAAAGVQVGAATVASRFALDEVAPLTLAMLRYGIGALCLLPFALTQWQRQRAYRLPPTPGPLAWRDWLRTPLFQTICSRRWRQPIGAAAAVGPGNA